MATRKVKLTGIAEWAKVFPEIRDLTGYKPTPDAIGTYEATDGACTINVIMDQENYDKLKATKSMKVGKDDPEGRGKRVALHRPYQTKNDWDGGPPLVLKSDGTVWDYSIDGTIGNGSLVEVYLAVYDIPKYGSTGTRLDKVKVLEHVEYIQPQDDGDVPPATKIPSKKKASEDAEVLF